MKSHAQPSSGWFGSGRSLKNVGSGKHDVDARSRGTGRTIRRVPPKVLGDAFAKKVCELIIVRGWSLDEFAARAHVSQAGFRSRLGPQQRKSTFGFLEKVAAAFDMPLSALIRDVETEIAPPRKIAPVEPALQHD